LARTGDVLIALWRLVTAGVVPNGVRLRYRRPNSFSMSLYFSST
jgi:hypothetical protein